MVFNVLSCILALNLGPARYLQSQGDSWKGCLASIKVPALPFLSCVSVSFVNHCCYSMPNPAAPGQELNSDDYTRSELDDPSAACSPTQVFYTHTQGHQSSPRKPLPFFILLFINFWKCLFWP